MNLIEILKRPEGKTLRHALTLPFTVTSTPFRPAARAVNPGRWSAVEGCMREAASANFRVVPCQRY